MESDASFWQTDAAHARHRLNVVLQLRQLQGEEVHLTTRHDGEYRGRLEIVGQSHLRILSPKRGEGAFRNVPIDEVIVVARA